MTLSAPVRLAELHQTDDFDCGADALNAWLKRRARPNQANGASRSFVACQGDLVIGFYALAAGAVEVVAAPGRFRRNMPDPVPVVVLGRLAVDRAWHGRGLGRGLFRDAALRVVQAAEIVGVRGLLVHARSEEARAFYLGLGLSSSPLDPMTLMVTLSELRD
ncbi:MAG: GNAT family N-acetyltransferase [Acetobacteraceae bacterium]|nr:GNAT family N-acetyltransferase [Acetobacteraceae bacterium]